MAKRKAPKEQAEKREVGRPSDYEPRFCQMLIDHMAAGYSFESFAGVIRKARSSLYLWLEAHPEFSDAKSLGTDLNLLFWEKKGIEGLEKPLNTTVWIFNMKNRHKWRDKSAEEIAEEGQSQSLRDMSDSELLAIVAKRKGNG